MKIHCIESQRQDFDKTSFEELRKMVGWIEPPEIKNLHSTSEEVISVENGSWDVTMADGSGFECKDQATAQIIASLEEIKAILMRK